MMPAQPSLLTRRHFLASTALAAGALALSPLANAQAPRSAGTLRVAFEADITGGDPYRSRGIQEEQDRISAGLQRYLADQMLVSGLVAITFLQAGRSFVKDFMYLGGQRVSFETAWLDSK